jgi:hypothetical protein
MEMRIPAGAQVYFGAPAKPMEQGSVAAISELLKSAPETIEAHLPQCYVQGTMQEPAQILVVVFSPEADLEHLLRSLKAGIASLALPGGNLDIWQLAPSSNMLPTIRKAGCSLKSVSSVESEIHLQPKKRWKFW